MEKNSSKRTLVKSLSAMLIYWLLNICDILMSTSPMAAHCQHAFKLFALSVQLYCSTTYQMLLSNQHWLCMHKITSLKLVYYCIVVFMACHFDSHNHNISSHFIIKQVIKLMALHQNNILVNCPFKHITLNILSQSSQMITLLPL